MAIFSKPNPGQPSVNGVATICPDAKNQSNSTYAPPGKVQSINDVNATTFGQTMDTRYVVGPSGWNE